MFFFQEAAGLCISYCLLINRTDILFGWIYERCSESVLKKAAFIERLQPRILSGELTQISPEVMKDFVDHYEKQGALGVIEACIVNVDIANTDVKQVVIPFASRLLFYASNDKRRCKKRSNKKRKNVTKI